VVGRLVFDVLWRNRWFYVLAGVFLLPCWLMFGMVSRSNPLPISFTAFSLIFAAVLGPMVVITTMSLRELRHLPVTNRDLWRTTWIAATVVSAGVLLATKTIIVLLVAAFGGSPKVSAEEILFSTVYDFSWAGALLLLFSLLSYTGHAGAHGGTLAKSLAPAGSIVAILACFGLPILVSDALPTRADQLTSATTGVLIAGLAIAFGALAWTPRRGALTGERARAAFAPKALPPSLKLRRTAAALAEAGRRASPKLQRRRADRLTGIPRVIVPHLLATLALPVGACLVLASYGVITGSGPWWFMPQAPTVFDPADIGDRGLTYFVLLPCGVVTMVSLWTPWARWLKVLPLSVRQINALLLFTPFATWTILWLLGWSAYVFAYGTPRTLRVEFVFGMAGIGALGHAALLRFQGSAATVWILAFSGGLMPQWVKLGLHDGIVAHVVFAVIGAIALSTAAFVNHRTLTRSTSSSLTYRRPQSPFGKPAMPSFR
jgi:hypothetical protein